MLIESGVLYMLFFVSSSIAHTAACIALRLFNTVASTSNHESWLRERQYQQKCRAHIRLDCLRVHQQSRCGAFDLSTNTHEHLTPMRLQGIYPTVVVILVNSERSVLKLGSGVGSPGSTLVHKRSQATNAGEGTYTSASTTGPGRAPVKTIDLYEMARLRDGEEADSDAKDRSTSIRV